MKNVLTKALLAGVAEMALFAVLLFASAGTIRWIGAWVFIVIMLALIVIVSLMLAKHDPDLLKERLAMPLQSGQKGWDKILMVALLVLFIAWMPLMGLDAIRYQWSHIRSGSNLRERPASSSPFTFVTWFSVKTPTCCRW